MSGQIKITSIGIILALALIIIFNLYWKKQKLSGELINASFIYNKRISEKETEALTNKLDKYCKKITFISLSSTETQSTINLDITPNDFDSIGKISDEIQNLDKNIKVMMAKDNLLSL